MSGPEIQNRKEIKNRKESGNKILDDYELAIIKYIINMYNKNQNEFNKCKDEALKELDIGDIGNWIGAIQKYISSNPNANNYYNQALTFFQNLQKEKINTTTDYLKNGTTNVCQIYQKLSSSIDTSDLIFLEKANEWEKKLPNLIKGIMKEQDSQSLINSFGNLAKMIRIFIKDKHYNAENFFNLENREIYYVFYNILGYNKNISTIDTSFFKNNSSKDLQDRENELKKSLPLYSLYLIFSEKQTINYATYKINPPIWKELTKIVKGTPNAYYAQKQIDILLPQLDNPTISDQQKKIIKNQIDLHQQTIDQEAVCVYDLIFPGKKVTYNPLTKEMKVIINENSILLFYQKLKKNYILK